MRLHDVQLGGATCQHGLFSLAEDSHLSSETPGSKRPSRLLALHDPPAIRNRQARRSLAMAVVTQITRNLALSALADRWNPCATCATHAGEFHKKTQSQKGSFVCLLFEGGNFFEVHGIQPEPRGLVTKPKSYEHVVELVDRTLLLCIEHVRLLVLRSGCLDQLLRSTC